MPLQITEDDINNTSLEAVTSLFYKLLENSPDFPHLQQLTNLLIVSFNSFLGVMKNKKKKKTSLTFSTPFGFHYTRN